MTRTLRPGDDISRYRIVGPLGAGGMGEVYRARDTNLDRDVALKVLPPTLVRSEERVRRFVLEAKSASSLNHPNIVTIYEIGEDQVVSSDGTADATPAKAHFISMELVSGDTLGTKIHDEKTDLKTLLGWMAQAADGVAKAHAAGIVHRDLKPGNIMISNDGYAKVLDFGLAKLTEKADLDTVLSTAPTEVGNRTTEGVVLGTVGYMSPEQVRGKGVDARTDIFSLGCILYECATRRRPFVAESSIETMHSILNANPTPIEESNPAVPAELRRLIRRCLSKSSDQRLQSAKDLAIELREIVDDYESLSASATSAGSGGTAAHAMPSSGSGSGSMAPPSSTSGQTVAASPRRFPWIPILFAAVVAVATALGLALMRDRGKGSTAAPADLKIATITNKGDIDAPVISPDGRYLAYVSGPEERRRVFVRQIATGSDIEVLPSLTIPPEGLNFSPDGNYLYYLAPDPEHPGYRGLYRVPSLGGASTRLVYDVDSKPTFDPTGKRVAFIRGVPQEKSYDLMILELESGNVTLLKRTTDPERLTPAPEWSPDGQWIAATYQASGESPSHELALVNAKDGSIRRVPNFTVFDPRSASYAWLPDSRSLVSCGYTLDEASPFPLRLVSIDGRSTRLTNTLDSFENVSASADGKQVVAQRTTITSNLWILDTTLPQAAPKQLTFNSGTETAIQSFKTAPDGSIVYQQGGSADITLAAMEADGSRQRSLRSDSASDFYLLIRGDTWFVQRSVLSGERTILSIWRYDGEGGARRRIGKGDSEFMLDVSSDGKTVLFCDWHDVSHTRRMDADGNNVRTLTENSAGPNALFSPDGTLFGYRAFRERDGRNTLLYTVARVEDGSMVSIPELPVSADNVKWSLDGRSFLFSDWSDSASNIYRMPLDTGAIQRVTHFTTGRVLDFKPSPDGTRIAVGINNNGVQNIWMMNADGSNPVQVTNFLTGDIFDAEWMPDGRRLVFTYGDRADDAVMVTNFR